MTKNLLADEVLKLRAVEPEDIEQLYNWENDTSIWNSGCSIAPYSKKTIWEYIENYNPDIFKANQLRLMIALRDSGDTIGTIDLYEFDYQNRRAGIGILIDSKYRSKGYATRSLDIVSTYCGEFLGLHQLWATIGSDNPHSLNLFKKCGYITCGRLRSWLRIGKSYTDALILQKFID